MGQEDVLNESIEHLETSVIPGGFRPEMSIQYRLKFICVMLFMAPHCVGWTTSREWTTVGVPMVIRDGRPPLLR